MKKIIVITGASGGIGAMLALRLAKKGHHIVCIGRSEETLFEVAQRINTEAKSFGGSASYNIVNMMSEDAVLEAGVNILTEFGSIDVWINNVGANNLNATGPTWELSAENWWTEVSLNLFTAYLGTSTAINLMKEQNSGYVINVGGDGVQVPKAYCSAYGAAKTGIVKFTETINTELEKEDLNIKAFAFNPGFIRNERTEKLLKSDVCRKYMPDLEEAVKNNQVSNIDDSIHLIETIISGKADALAGKYFFSDDRNIDEAIANQERLILEELNLLRVKQ